MKKRKVGFFLPLFLLLALLCLSMQASAYTGFKTTKKGAIRYYNSSGTLVKNQWFTVKKQKYYAKANGDLAKGLTQIDGKYYYFDNKGRNKKGWKTINGKKYYFLSSQRYAATGMFTFKSGKTYYFSKKGVMQTGWKKIDGKYYYFKPNMKTGWLTLNGKKYYLIRSSEMKGQRASGIFSVGGKLYYFDPDTGVMQTSKTVVYNDRTYEINSKGVCTVEPDSSAPTEDMLFFLEFESGSNGYDQTGGSNGSTCGAYQFHYNYALLPFVKYAYAENPTVCAEFKTYASYTDKTKLKNNQKFYQAWHKIYSRNKKTFSALQDTYARVNYYDNVERTLGTKGIDISSRSDIVKGAVFSYSVQHGQSKAIAAVKAIKATSSMSDATFLKKLYDYRTEQYPTYASRYTSEYNLAISKLNAASS